jgi:hypothetical protein
MDQTEHRSDVVTEALALAKKADEMKGAAITQLLAQREQIERDLNTLGYVQDHRLNGNGAKNGANGSTLHHAVEDAVTAVGKGAKRFRSLKLAEVVRILLQEHGSLHGKQIEEYARVGGFKRGTANFQNYLPVALKRDGGFENTGGNTWQLKSRSA